MPVHDAFTRCAEYVDQAQRAMLRSVPSSARAMAVPVTTATETLRLALADARGLLPAWRHPAVEEHWRACRAALDDTVAGIALCIETCATTDELEDALTAVSDLLAPLHAFVDAQDTFAALRTRR